MEHFKAVQLNEITVVELRSKSSLSVSMVNVMGDLSLHKPVSLSPTGQG